MTLKLTPLNATHRAARARMVDFGGWDMPVNYGSQIEEHHAVRQSCGLFDVSHMCAVDVTGPDAERFLRRVFANDVARLTVPGKALYSCMLNEAGKVIDDLIVYFFAENRYRIVINAGTAATDLTWLHGQHVAQGLDVQLRARRGDFEAADAALAIVAIQGPQARDIFWKAVPEAQSASENLGIFFAAEHIDTPFGGLMVARTGYTGEDGFEVICPAESVVALWNALVTAGARPCGLGARDTLRLEAGMNLYGQDMDVNTNPLDAGLAWTVALKNPRAFVGREALERDGQRHQFLGLVLRESGGILRSHQKVLTEHGEGEITSGTFSPTLQASIALARLPLNVKVGDTVHVAIRDKKLTASVVKPPFARHGAALVQ
jgi:aminomethyltransferase